MKMLIAGAGLIVASALAPAAIATPAAAQRTVVHERTVVRHEGPRHRAHTRRVCEWKSRHHHRVRVCRTVRWR